MDARLRSEWLGRMRFDNLTETAWRVFTGALMWSVANETDGRIPGRYTKYLHPDGDQPVAFAELVEAGIWAPIDGDGFQLVDWDGELGQSTAAEVQAYRENARERQRRYRERAQERKSGASTAPAADPPNEPAATRDKTGDVTRDVTRGVGTAKAQAKASANYQPTRKVGDEALVEAKRVDSWPVAELGSGGAP